MRAQNYVGYAASLGKMERFLSDIEPTSASHGERYVFVIGPFRTARAARWAEKYGHLNPHFNQVADAERISALPEFAQGWAGCAGGEPANGRRGMPPRE